MFNFLHKFSYNKSKNDSVSNSKTKPNKLEQYNSTKIDTENFIEREMG